MYKEKKSLATILQELLSQYYNPTDQDSANLRKKVEAICKKIRVGKTNLWEKAKTLEGNRARYYFDYKGQEMLLNSPELWAYINPRKVSQEEYEEYKRLSEQAAADSTKYRAALEDGYCGPDMETDGRALIGIDEAHKKKIELMIEALYCLHFHPIDDAELYRDLLLDANRQDDDVSVDCVRAHEHLQQGALYYCKPKN